VVKPLEQGVKNLAFLTPLSNVKTIYNVAHLEFDGPLECMNTHDHPRRSSGGKFDSPQHQPPFLIIIRCLLGRQFGVTGHRSLLNNDLIHH
jgi:hypothetical protein